jgi:hypothetical protein
MSFEDFLRLLISANCLAGNLSVGLRETSYLGGSTVNIGNRQIGHDRGPNVIDTGYFAEEVVDAVKRHLANGKYPSSCLYGNGAAGNKIADLLAAVR